MKKQNLQSKLRDYSLAATVVLIAKSEAESQIAYHHYDPPNYPYSDESLDLNNDGIFDLQFNVSAFANNNGGYNYSYEIYSWERTIRLDAMNHAAIAVSFYGYQLTKLNLGQLINSSLSWCECGELLAHEYKNYDPWFHSYSGYWFDQGYGYFGFRLKSGTDKYYGWMRMFVDDTYVILYDYAYNSIPNQPILAGETGCDWLNASIESSPGDTVCNGDTIILKADPASGFNFSWKKVGGYIYDIDSVYYVASGTADYFVIVSMPNSCYDTSAVVHTAHINPVSAGILFNNDTLFSTLPNVAQWYLNEDPIPGATDNYYVPIVTGSYEVITYAGDCYATSSSYYFLATGAQAIESPPFPKISLEDLNLIIELPKGDNRSKVFSINDILGRKHLEIISPDSSLRIPINELPAGEYILVIRDEWNQTTFKFLKL